MTVKSNRLLLQETQRTMASTWDPDAGSNLQRAELTLQPRSQRARDLENTRPGSLRTGLGRFRLSGRSPGFINGAGDPRIVTEPD